MSKPPKKVHRVEVEQAIAFGRSHVWMVEHLGATPAEIAAAIRWVEECNAEDDDLPRIECGTPKAYNRHKMRGEPIDARCRYAEAAHQASRREAKKARDAAPHPVADLSRPVDSYYGPATPDTITGILKALQGAA